MQFRQDINGLRAIAVMAVVLFHFNETWITGGFAGVDVFFVISGFLMTGIIFRGIETDTFSLYRFYKARVKRILPALSMACLFVLIYGFWELYDIELKDTVNQSISALSFWSNFYFWKTSSYFSAGSETKILLHTWSLSAEWQFYIIYPFLIFLLSKLFDINKLKYIVFIAFSISLIISIYASPKWATNAYYLLPTRGWEMMLGGLAVFIKLNLKTKYLKLCSLLGLFVIFSSYFMISKNNIWPGYLALIPTFGTFLILISNVQLKLLSNKLVQTIGTYSYSIYLWHWIVVYMSYRYTNMGYGVIALGGLLSFFLGRLSYEYIEKKGLSIGNKLIIVFSFLCTLSFYMFSEELNKFRPISKSPNNALVTYYEDKKSSTGPWVDNICVKKGECVKGGVFLWGDSHAHSLYHGLKSLELPDLSAVTTQRCSPSLNYPDYKLQYGITCNENNKKAIEHIAYKKPKTVILARRDKHDSSDWEGVALKLKELGVEKVIVVGPVPQFRGELPLLVAKKYFGDIVIKKQDMDKNIFISNEKMNGKRSINYIYIDVLKSLCNKNECHFQSVKGDNFKLITSDYGHLNDEGSIFIVNELISNQIVD